jgi:hypothetical protein
MGPYLPTGTYLVQATFEAVFQCRSPAEQSAIARETIAADQAQQAAQK